MDSVRKIYERIVRAAEKGMGVHLSAKECWQISRDDAIISVAMGREIDEEDKENGT